MSKALRKFRQLNYTWTDAMPENYTGLGQQSSDAYWVRRVRWYNWSVTPPPGVPDDIRLCFEDKDGRVNQVYATREQAQTDYDAFTAGRLSVMMVKDR